MARAAAGKIRLDRLLVERGLVDSREKAQALILAGQILVDNQKAEKCGLGVSLDASIRLLGQPAKYVSRGGLKLEAALDGFGVDVEGKAVPRSISWFSWPQHWRLRFVF